MNLVTRLYEMDREHPKTIAVVGDSMTDTWIHGSAGECQDHCRKLLVGETVMTPGGAAGAARQLFRWPSRAMLISPWRSPLFREKHWETVEAFSQVDSELCFEEGVVGVPLKTRLLDGNRIVFRYDAEKRYYGLGEELLDEYRRCAVKAIAQMKFDAVLISDYDKGFLDSDTIRDIVLACRSNHTPVVADGKKRPSAYAGAIIKCNNDYALAHGAILQQMVRVVTHGAFRPVVSSGYRTLPEPYPDNWHGRAVECVNDVGAGDAFAATMALALAHGMDIDEAALIAHSAGRVYVTHRHGRPPWPFEVALEHEPMTGKVVNERDAEKLALALAGKGVVFANGVFRVPHAGHAAMLSWARQQGGVLVVGINDDASAGRMRNGQFVLPLAERVAALAAMSAVDWIIPFHDDTPLALTALLRPDVLVKGAEYSGAAVPGTEHVKKVVFSPMFFDGRHATDLVGDRETIERLQKQIEGHADRIAAQSELLSKRSEKG